MLSGVIWSIGGFVYLDAGIKASFLGSDLGHSYAAWEERPEVRELFLKFFQRKHLFLLPATMIYSELFFVVYPRMKI